MTDLYQIKAQMRKEHRILKTRKFFRNKSVVIGAAVLLIIVAARARWQTARVPCQI